MLMLVLQYDQEMEEREKLVGRMWDMYTRTSDEVRLPRFWQEAFEAAYEELAGDDVQVRDAAISEIARMSAHKLELEQTLNENEVCPKTVSHLNCFQIPYVLSKLLCILRFPLFCESDTSYHVNSSHFEPNTVMKPGHAFISHFQTMVPIQYDA
jgi:hypothetical protein